LFERVAVAALTFTLVALIAHFVLRGRTGRAAADAPARWPISLTLAGVLACGVTALVPLWGGAAMRGWWMFAHVSAAPLLIAGLAAVAVQRPPRRTRRVDSAGLRPQDPSGDRGGTVTGFFGWTTPAVGAIAVGAILLNMPAWFGQETMAVLLSVHRYAGLLLCIVVMIHGYRAWFLRI
jgi:hypothetical protein